MSDFRIHNGLNNVSLLPVGTILWFSGTKLPSGYLECDGSNVDRRSFFRLFDAIGTTYGNGDGSSTFTLPNLKGEGAFIRSRSSTQEIGVSQGDAIRNISGGIGLFGNAYAGLYSERVWGAFSTRSAGDEGGERPVLNSTTGEQSASVTVEMTLSASRQVPTANENRPKNIAMMAIIRY